MKVRNQAKMSIFCHFYLIQYWKSKSEQFSKKLKVTKLERNKIISVEYKILYIENPNIKLKNNLLK